MGFRHVHNSDVDRSNCGFLHHSGKLCFGEIAFVSKGQAGLAQRAAIRQTPQFRI